MRKVTQVNIFNNFVSFRQKFEQYHAEDTAYWMTYKKPDAPEGLWHGEKCEQKYTPQKHVNGAAPKDDPMELVKDHLGLVR